MIGLEVIERLRTIRRRMCVVRWRIISTMWPRLTRRCGEVTKRWSEDDDVDRRMIRHALRTLIKQGNPGAMERVGFHNRSAGLPLRLLGVPASISLGDSIEMASTCVSESDKRQKLVVDFLIHHPTATGNMSSKVFKWATLDLGPRERIELRKKRKIATASTRKYTAGEHRIELLVAGQVVAETSFDLRDSS